MLADTRTNPLLLAKEIVATGEVNVNAVASLSARNFNTFEQRLGRIVLENAQLTDRMMDQMEAGTSRHDTADSMRRFLESPQGQARLQDPVMREILINYAEADDRSAARAAADEALRNRVQEWDQKMPEIMQKIEDARPEQQASFTMRPAGIGLG